MDTLTMVLYDSHDGHFSIVTVISISRICSLKIAMIVLEILLYMKFERITFAP